MSIVTAFLGREFRHKEGWWVFANVGPMPRPSKAYRCHGLRLQTTTRAYLLGILTKAPVTQKYHPHVCTAANPSNRACLGKILESLVVACRSAAAARRGSLDAAARRATTLGRLHCVGSTQRLVPCSVQSI